MAQMVKYITEGQDINDISRLLVKASLPIDDLKEGKIDFITATDENDVLVGCIGIESYGTEGLLRSLAVDETWRNKKMGYELVNRLMKLCRQRGIINLHLLTNTAESFFKRIGFSVFPRDKAPASIKETAEFTSICPSTSVYMVMHDIKEN